MCLYDHLVFGFSQRDGHSQFERDPDSATVVRHAGGLCSLRLAQQTTSTEDVAESITRARDERPELCESTPASSDGCVVVGEQTDQLLTKSCMAQIGTLPIVNMEEMRLGDLARNNYSLRSTSEQMAKVVRPKIRSCSQ